MHARAQRRGKIYFDIRYSLFGIRYSNPLPIFNRVSLACKNIVLDIDPEGKDHIDDQGRAHGNKGDIDKPHPDPRRSDTEFFTYCGANAKCT
jgi:hypothetical protein